MSGIRMLVADDEVTVRAFVAAVISREKLPVDALWQADNGTDAVQLAARHRPHLILLDIRMPGLNGLQAAEAILAAEPRARVVILSAHHEFEYVRTAFRAGAADYLLKPVKPAELAELIRATAQALETLGDSAAPDKESETATGVLSPPVAAAMAYISQHLAQPLSLRDIAQAIFVSPSHLSRTFKQQTGQALTGYIQEQRLRCAAGLLLATGDSVSDIAGRCGFGDSSYFATCFKQHYGISPLQYRRQNQRPTSPAPGAPQNFQEKPHENERTGEH